MKTFTREGLVTGEMYISGRKIPVHIEVKAKGASFKSMTTDMTRLVKKYTVSTLHTDKDVTVGKNTYIEWKNEYTKTEIVVSKVN